jgi:hypothetical protein
MEARNRSLPDWLTRIRTHQIVLPRFQRFEAWGYGQVENLLNTVLQGLPSGAVLTLEVGNEELFRSRPIVTAPEAGEKVTEHLLDGQQRLTSLWRSLNNSYEDRLYLIKLESDEEASTPQVISVGRYEKKGLRYPLWADQANELWKRKLLPIHLMRPDAEKEAKDWAKAAGADSDAIIEILETINFIRNKFSVYNIPFLSLPVTTKPEVALNVFIQMNTSSSPLTAFDIVVAQLEAATGKSLHGYIEELKRETNHINRFGSIEETVLAVAALLDGKVPSKSTYLSREFSNSFEENWPQIKVGIKKALSFLADEKIYDSRRLPTEVVMSVISALWAGAPEGLDKGGEARMIIRKYIWRSFFTDRYDRSTNTRSFADYKELIKLIAEENGTPEIFNEALYPISQAEDLLVTAWPTRKDRLARAILAISLKAGGFDFADSAPASYENIQNREYHHIFPKSWLENRNYKDHEINRALNCALISWRTNRNISAKTPSEYVAERMEKSSLGEEEVRRRLESHLVPIEELHANDYPAFIQKRADLIIQWANKLCEGQIIEGML